MYMTYTLTVTSQGQVTIPADIRRLWGLMKRGQITLTLQGKKVAKVEPARDILDYVGSLNKYAVATKGMNADQVIKMEEEAAAEAVAENYIKKQKRSGNKLLKIKTW